MGGPCHQSEPPFIVRREQKEDVGGGLWVAVSINRDSWTVVLFVLQNRGAGSSTKPNLPAFFGARCLCSPLVTGPGYATWRTEGARGGL